MPSLLLGGPPALPDRRWQRPSRRLRRRLQFCRAMGAAAQPLSTQDLVDYLRSGCKPRSQWKCAPALPSRMWRLRGPLRPAAAQGSGSQLAEDPLGAPARTCRQARTGWRRFGTEHEKLGYYLDTRKRLEYSAIRRLLEGLVSRFQWQPIMEGEYIIGCERNGQSVTIEPGGQFELSGAPLASLHDTQAETQTHLEQARSRWRWRCAGPGRTRVGPSAAALHAEPCWPVFRPQPHEPRMLWARRCSHAAGCGGCSAGPACPQVRSIAQEVGIAFLTLGFDPKWQVVDVPIMPKHRYRCGAGCRRAQAEGGDACPCSVAAGGRGRPSWRGCCRALQRQRPRAGGWQGVPTAHALAVLDPAGSRFPHPGPHRQRAPGSCARTWPRWAAWAMT